MKISEMSRFILDDIYNLSMQDSMNEANLDIDSIAKSHEITTDFVFKCLTYLFDKQWVMGENGAKLIYGGKSVKVKLNASGIDLVEN